MLKFTWTRLTFPIVLLFIFFAFLYLFNSGNRFIYNKQGGLSHIDFEKAEIVRVVSESLEKDENIKGLYRGTQDLEVKILTGEHKGEVQIIKNYSSDLFNVHGKAGMKIIVSIDTAEPGIYRISVYNYHRTPFIYFIIFLFLFSLWVVGGKKGLKSIIGLTFTFISIIFLFIPMLFKGYSPVFASVLIVILTTIVTVFCINGWSVKSFSAILGTSLGVIIAGSISSIFGILTHISGFSTEEAETLIVIASYTNMKVSDLLFAGILISSLGAVMDVAISIAASIHEVYMANPNLTKKDLFSSGMNVGRDMMGTMANTLILAFTGTSINSLILLYSYNVKYNQLMNMNLLGIEIIQGMSGSIGIILTVPIISFISSRLFPVILKNESKTSN